MAARMVRSDVWSIDPSPNVAIAAVHISQLGFSLPPNPTRRHADLMALVRAAELNPSASSLRQATTEARKTALNASLPFAVSMDADCSRTMVPNQCLAAALQPASLGCDQMVVCDGTQIGKMLFSIK
jgi:hypothetical protein